MKRLVLTAAICGSLLAWAVTAGAEPLVMALVDGDYGGIPREMFERIKTDLTAGLQKKTGKPFDIAVFSTAEDLRQAARENKVDFVMAGIDYPIAKGEGVPLLPLATLEIKGQYKFADCLWVAKDAPFETVDQLAGRKLVMNLYPTLWGVLIDAGIGKSPLEFFGKVYMYRDSVLALKSVLSGAVDVMLMGESYMKFHEFDETLKGAFKPVACSEPVVATNLMHHRDVPAELLDQITLIVQNIHRDPDFSSLRFMFLSTGGTMRVVKADEFANAVEMYEKAAKLNWTKELSALENAPILDDELGK